MCCVRFISNLSYSRDEASHSLTIIEKLERDAAAIGFCFILYTPDDIGALQHEEPRPRARQNVIFEHGLVIGILGRGRTCAIITGDVELPSDVHGMAHERIGDLDRESLRVARVLKQAGYEVDIAGLLL